MSDDYYAKRIRAFAQEIIKFNFDELVQCKLILLLILVHASSQVLVGP